MRGGADELSKRRLSSFWSLRPADLAVCIGWISRRYKHEVEKRSRLAPGTGGSDGFLACHKQQRCKSSDTQTPVISWQYHYERQLESDLVVRRPAVARTRGARADLSDSKAGSRTFIDGVTWRVSPGSCGKGIPYSSRQAGIRKQLVARLSRTLAPRSSSSPHWLSLSGRPQSRLRHYVRWPLSFKAETADDMSPIEPGKVPTEIRPVVTSLMDCFSKV